jgi:hypothetical protein
MTASVARRRRSAYAAAVAAKQRRQKIFLGVLLAGVIALLAWEAPGILHHLKGGSSVGAPVSVSTPPAHARSLPRAFRGQAGDPFAARALTDGDSQVAPASGNDPFAAPPTSSSSSSSGATAATVQPLPEQIVIGTPSGRGAIRGWIVILASIPTPNGRSSAVSFANEARRNGVGSVSVLNSSNRRPLRGGYWVVYTGPVQTLNAVDGLASNVHARGYGTAYIRQLVIYR